MPQQRALLVMTAQGLKAAMMRRDKWTLPIFAAHATPQTKAGYGSQD